MTKKIMMMIVMFVFAITAAFAQADKIVGTYKALRDGVNSKVKVFKYKDGYRAQVIWVDNLMNEDGSVRLDAKNPDPEKRKVQADKIVLIDKVVYKDGKWTDGKIYDPTSGKVYTVNLYFDKNENKKLTVKGSIGPFFQRMYWTKIQ